MTVRALPATTLPAHAFMSHACLLLPLGTTFFLDTHLLPCLPFLPPLPAWSPVFLLHHTLCSHTLLCLHTLPPYHCLHSVYLYSGRVSLHIHGTFLRFFPSTTNLPPVLPTTFLLLFTTACLLCWLFCSRCSPSHYFCYTGTWVGWFVHTTITPHT